MTNEVERDRFLHELDLVAPNIRASHNNTVFTRDEVMRAFDRFTLARQSVGVEEMRKWALDKAAIHHQFAHDDEYLRTEHIASSSAYRNLAEELPTILSRVGDRAALRVTQK